MIELFKDDDKMAMMISAKGLSKEYKGHLILRDFSLELEAGEILALIGPNASGKTTALKILSGLVKPTSGSAQICGYDLSRQSPQIRGILGYLPEDFGVYEGLKVWEYLDFFAQAHKLKKQKRMAVISDLLEIFDLTSFRNRYAAELSRGLKRKLGLARTLVHDPQVILLDEPFDGLDQKSRLELGELLKELANMGKAAVVASNSLTDLDEPCNKIGVLQAGKLIIAGSRSELADKLGLEAPTLERIFWLGLSHKGEAS